MADLLNAVVNDMSIPPALLLGIAEAHAFRVVNGGPDVAELGRVHPGYRELAIGIFLPAPVTWIEAVVPDLGKVGFLCRQQTPREVRVDSIMLPRGDAPEVSPQFAITGPLGTDAPQSEIMVGITDRAFSRKMTGVLYTVLVGLLQLINLPHGLVVTEEAPHRAADKRLRQRLGRAVAFNTYRVVRFDPLKAEAPTPETSASGSRRPVAYHFVRSFGRMRRGRFEVVRAHWRGDPTVGLVATSYEVGAARGAAQ